MIMFLMESNTRGNRQKKTKRRDIFFLEIRVYRVFCVYLITHVYSIFFYTCKVGKKPGKPGIPIETKLH